MHQLETASVPPPLPGAAVSLSNLWAMLVLIFLTVHTLWTAAGFVLHYYDAANRPKGEHPSASGYLAAWALEWWYSFAATLLYPFGLLPPAGDPYFDPRGGPPIVLVHGYATNRSIMYALYWRLRRHRFRNVYLVTLRPMFGSIETIGERLRPRLADISKQAGGAPLHAICHSMGGLVMRWYAHRDDAVPLAKIVCIGTPHGGTRLGVLAPGDNGHQMRRRSRLLRALPRKTPVPVVSLYSLYDNFVIPPSSAAFGDRVYRFDIGGHGSLLYDRRAFGTILHELER